MKVMKSERSKTFSYSVFYEQAPEGGYVAFVPALPGCHTQGETLESTERNVKEAIAVYLESLAAHGDAIPIEGPSFRGRVTVPALPLTRAQEAELQRRLGSLDQDRRDGVTWAALKVELERRCP
jgi:antitoxin HicB